MTARMTMEGGASTEISFLGDPGDQLLVSLHRPSGPVRGLIVIASSVQMEALKNGRREVLVARRLADDGFAVARLQYRGTRNSDGDILDVTTQTMAEDLVRVTDFAVDATGTDNIGFMATRLSSLAMSRVLDAYPKAPVALWDPASSGKRYFKELLRFVLMRNMKHQEGMTSKGLLERFEADGFLDVHGFPVGWQLHEDTANKSLGAEYVGDGRHVALFQLGRASDLRAEYRDTVESWREAGAEVDITLVPYVEAWWFSSDGYDAKNGAALRDALVDGTVEWFEKWM